MAGDPRMREAALSVHHVDRSFASPEGGTVDVLRDINLTLEDGEFVTLVGASGSGKSTLLRIVDGLIPPSAGRVAVAGQPVAGPGPDRAFVFQQDSLLPWRSVLDNVAYGLRLAGTRRDEARARAQELVDLTGLKGFEQYFPHQISGGMRQRANVARALVMDPKILLLDEPFAALDAQTREIMQSELLRIWSERTKTVLFVTHQIDEAVFLSDRVAVLSARPGTIREIISIDLPRPRALSIKRTEPFIRYSDRIWSLIEEEVRAGMGMVTTPAAPGASQSA